MSELFCNGKNVGETLKIETEKEKKYIPVGILNLLPVIPNQASVVFTDEDNNLYCGFIDDKADLENRFFYNRFVSIPEGEIRENIKYFKELKCEKEEVNKSYSVGDIIVLAFQTDENTAYVGRIDKYVNFLNQFKSTLVEGGNDKLLLNEIEDYLVFYDLSKTKFEEKSKIKEYEKQNNLSNIKLKK